MTHQNGNGTDPIKAVLATVQDATGAFLAVPELARLSAVDYGIVKGQLRERLGTKLSVRDLDRAVNEARRAHGAAIGAVAGDGRVNLFPDELQFADVIEATVTALNRWNDPARLFVQSSLLVEVVGGQICPVTTGRMREILALAINFARRSGGTVADITPPEKIIGTVLERRRWPFPELRAITRVPVLRPDGTLVATAGYDQATQLYYDPLPGVTIPAVPERPNYDDLRDARALIDYMLQDFPFVDQASRTNYLAVMLTAVARPAIIGPTPLAVIDAAKAGTGKSKLSKVPQIVVFSGGGFMGWSKSERETAAAITSQLRANPGGVYVIDNIDPGAFSSGSLARLLTADVWEARLLGENTMLRLPNLATWIANGNNITPAGDLPRRCYLVKLEAQTSRPWERSDFTIQNFDRWIEENAGRLFAALLTLARAWYVAGSPAGKLQAVNSYTDWLRVIGGILANAGIPGFLDNNEDLIADSEEDEGWGIFLAELAKIMPEHFTTADVIDKLFDGDKDGLTPKAEALRAVLPPDLLGERGFLDKHQMTKRLGEDLRKRDGTRYGRTNVYVRRMNEKTRTNQRLWQISLTADLETPGF